MACARCDVADKHSENEMMHRVFFNAWIWNQSATALSTRDGKIERVGSDQEILAHATSNSERIDLAGRTVVPGFHDCHLHLLTLGKTLILQANLVGSNSIDEMLDRLTKQAEIVDGWIVGHGFDQERMIDRRFPTRADLDRISKTRPIIAGRICRHGLVANSAAMALLSDEERSDGDVSSGLFVEQHQKAFFTKQPQPDDATLDRCLEAAMQLAIRSGITSVGSMLDSPEHFPVFDRMRRRLGRLPIRVTAMPMEAQAEDFASRGLITGAGDDWLRIGAAKFFADGSLGARTAWLSAPYADDSNTIGSRIYEPGALAKRMKQVESLGFQLACHAIGDAALDEALDAIEHALAGRSNDRRHRIEHASVARPDQIERLARLRIPVAIQPQFVSSDPWTLDRLGAHRRNWAYPFRSMKDAGVVLGLSSDAPIEQLNSNACLKSAIARDAGWPDESLTLDDAINAYTIGSAWLSGHASQLGHLEIGAPADFVVINDRDFGKVARVILAGTTAFEA